MNKLLILMLIVLLPIFLLSGCLNNGPILLISSSDWYTAIEEIDGLTFGYVRLDLSGSTTGDKVTLTTYGDGIIEEYELGLDQDKAFSQDILIKFTHEADDIARSYNTVVTAYSGNATTKISLESEELNYLPVIAE